MMLKWQISALDIISVLLFSYSITMGLYTMNYFEDLKRREKVVELMKKDDWRGVVEEFQVCKHMCGN